MIDLAPLETAQRLAAGELLILDVREPDEWAIVRLPQAIGIPMSEIAQRVEELDPLRPIAVLCHHGGRSARVGDWLERRGFTAIFNVAGGIERWALDVDPSLPRY